MQPSNKYGFSSLLQSLVVFLQLLLQKTSLEQKNNWNSKSLAPQLEEQGFFVFILFENLFKSRQHPSATSKQYFELTSSVLSITSKQCFEQSAASFLVCSLIFIEYEFSGCQFSLDKDRVGRGVVLLSLHTWFQVYRSCSRGRLKCPRVEWIFPILLNSEGLASWPSLSR